MMSYFLENEKSGETAYRNRDEMISEILTINSIGAESISRVLTMAIYHLKENPKCLQKVFQEINENFGEKMNVTVEKLDKLEFMDSVLKETLRLVPPFGSVYNRLSINDH